MRQSVMLGSWMAPEEYEAMRPTTQKMSVKMKNRQTFYSHEGDEDEEDEEEKEDEEVAMALRRKKI